MKGASPVLRLQCADGSFHDVSFMIASVSPKLSQYIQEIEEYAHTNTCDVQSITNIYLGEVPTEGLEKALEYCRYLYLHLSTGNSVDSLQWDEDFAQLDSRLLCELASASYHLDIQPLVDVTCRSIAKLMSGRSAEEIRDTFKIDPRSGNCQSSGDFAEELSILEGFQGGLLSHYDDRSVDELMQFINEPTESERSSNRKRKSSKKKKRKKKGNKLSDLDDELVKKVQMASIDPSLVFVESQFEEDSSSVAQEVESFRLALEAAHQRMAETPKLTLAVPFKTHSENGSNFAIN